MNQNIGKNNFIQPICLEEDDSFNYENRHVEVAGWGTLRASGSQPNELRKVTVKVWKNSDCDRSYGSNAPGGITNGMVCANDLNRDSCSVRD